MRGGYSGDRDSKKALRGFEILRMNHSSSFLTKRRKWPFFEPYRAYCVFLLGGANTQIPTIGIFCPSSAEREQSKRIQLCWHAPRLAGAWNLSLIAASDVCWRIEGYSPTGRADWVRNALGGTGM